jgi:hypothetical protein
VGRLTATGAEGASGLERRGSARGRWADMTAKRRGVIRCHGRRSIFQALEGVAEQGLATDERVQPREPPARS